MLIIYRCPGPHPHRKLLGSRCRGEFEDVCLISVHSIFRVHCKKTVRLSALIETVCEWWDLIFFFFFARNY